jgi:putative DNA primase/helicase
MWAGLCLSGETTIQEFLYMFGPGGNGKSTVLEHLQEMFGDYAASFPAKNLIANDKYTDGERASPFLANIMGKRLVVCTEMEDNKSLDESMLKLMIGGKTVTTRRIYGSPFSFRTTHHMVLDANHLAHVRNQDKGIWRRITVLECRNIVLDTQVDPSLDNKIRAEYPGILNWAVEGYCRAQVFPRRLGNGLVRPKAVEAASADYQTDQDMLLRWYEERLTARANSFASSASLYADYADWARASGLGQTSIVTWGHRMSELAIKKGFYKARASDHARANGWQGVVITGEAL